jgi:hypothetical protein
MICLLGTAETPDVGIITRVRRARKGYRGVSARELLILGVRTLHITLDKTPSISQKIIKKRIKYASSLMRSERVSQVFFAKNFPYRELVLREGFDEMDECLLMKLFAGKLATEFADGEKVAAFFAERLTGDAERIFSELCRAFRYVIAVSEADGSQLFAAFGRQLGISVIGRPTPKQLLRADVAVFFSPPKQEMVLSEKCVVIPVTASALEGVVCRNVVTGITVSLVNGMQPDIPEGFQPGPLYAAAIRAGTLRLGDVLIQNIKMADMYM